MVLAAVQTHVPGSYHAREALGSSVLTTAVSVETAGSKEGPSIPIVRYLRWSPLVRLLTIL